MSGINRLLGIIGHRSRHGKRSVYRQEWKGRKKKVENETYEIYTAVFIKEHVTVKTAAQYNQGEHAIASCIELVVIQWQHCLETEFRRKRECLVPWGTHHYLLWHDSRLSYRGTDGGQSSSYDHLRVYRNIAQTILVSRSIWYDEQKNDILVTLQQRVILQASESRQYLSGTFSSHSIWFSRFLPLFLKCWPWIMPLAYGWETRITLFKS